MDKMSKVGAPRHPVSPVGTPKGSAQSRAGSTEPAPKTVADLIIQIKAVDAGDMTKTLKRLVMSDKTKTLLVNLKAFEGQDGTVTSNKECNLAIANIGLSGQ